MRLQTVFLAILITCISCGNGYANLAVNVEAASAKDRQVLEHAVRDVYPDLPLSQQLLIQQGLFFVVYDGPMAFDSDGFGPEDDPAYRYPDRTLYPTGTIMVNITRSSLLMMTRAAQGRKKSEKAVIELLAHEIKHVEQYMNHPVRALSVAGDCPLGYCADVLLEGTKIKLSYELEATRFGFKVAGVTLSDDAWKEIAFGYVAMYRPPVLARRCVERETLDKNERAEVRQFLKENHADRGVFERMYPFLTPVFKRLQECLRY